MSEQKASSLKGGIIALAICVVVIIILLGLVIFLMLNKEKKEEPIRRNIVVNEKNVDKVIEQLGEERTAPGSYEVTMNTTWNFPEWRCSFGKCIRKKMLRRIPTPFILM